MKLKYPTLSPLEEKELEELGILNAKAVLEKFNESYLTDEDWKIFHEMVKRV